MKYPLLGIFLLGWFTMQGQFIRNSGVPIKNSAHVTVNGDWVSAAGTSILNDGTIRTTDDFINHGTLDTKSKGRFVLHFTSDHEFKPGGWSFGTLIKEGAGKAMLTGSVNIRDSLILNRGLIQLASAYDTVCLRSGATLQADTGSYVTGGLFAREGTGDFVFPVGKDGRYLPLKLHGVQAVRVTVSVGDAPPGHTAGPGVSELIDFPYVWQVLEAMPQDTASYVELQYPNTLSSGEDLIVARQTPGMSYTGMGARWFENTGGRITVRSYSRRLKGVFTVARGFPSDPETDSLALVSLYQSSQGENWLNRANWLSGTVDTWFGITTAGGTVTGITLPDNNLTGSIPGPLSDIVTLEEIDLSGNKITAIPDFSGNPDITLLDVSDNNLTFASLEPNAALQGLNYLTQGEIGTALDTTVVAGSAFTFTAPAGGESSEYKWILNGGIIADTSSADFYVPAIGRNNMGEYHAEVTNPKLPGLTLTSKIQKVLAYANVSGTLFADSAIAAESGEVSLYRIQQGGFEVLASVPVGNDGAFEFENVILDDYQLRGFPDTVAHPGALPTFYKTTIFWEEADTVSLDNHLDGLDIIAVSSAGELTGGGSISGYLREDDAAGRTRDIRPVADVGVSAHRVELIGAEEKLHLAAYDFTNENGEFLLSGLPVGEYRLNFQYPGYPMDETSFTTVSIDDDSDAQVSVEATIADGKISVRKLAITGIHEVTRYSAEIYPNPAPDHVRLVFPDDRAARTIVLSDMAGKAVHSVNTNSHDVVIRLSGFQPGMYSIRIRESGIPVKNVKVIIK